MPNAVPVIAHDSGIPETVMGRIIQRFIKHICRIVNGSLNIRMPSPPMINPLRKIIIPVVHAFVDTVWISFLAYTVSVVGTGRLPQGERSKGGTVRKMKFRAPAA